MPQASSGSAPAKEAQSICLVICFFGKVPTWIKFFFKSCAHNPAVNFLLFTDCISSVDAPANVEIIPCTLEDIKAQADAALGLDISLDTPYKLCDLKAAYGAIFSAYLKPYTFWGMTDLDVVYGDIKRFITDDLLAANDVVTAHEDYLVGHFSLYRNAPPFSQLFRESKDYKQVFESPQMVSFSECGYEWTTYVRRQTKKAEAAQIDSMTHVVNRMAAAQQVQKSFIPLVREKPTLHKKNWLLLWQDGKLYNIADESEIMYFHFHLFKNTPLFSVPDWQQIPDTFYMNTHGFFE